MNIVNVNGHGFAGITLKLANMRKEQNFTLYPYKGGEDLMIQSTGRFAVVNVKTGVGRISCKNQNYNGFASLVFGALPFTLPAEALASIQKHLWDLDGQDGGSSVLSWENKPFLSEV